MRYDQISPIPPLTKITKSLVIICVVAYLFDFVLYHLGITVSGYNLNEIFGLVPAYVKDRYWLWQFVTYIFMHGHPLHILLNMLILWYFGAEIEMRMGDSSFLKYFLICGVGAGIFNFLVNVAFSNSANLSSPIVGASGAIYGILAAYGIFFGNRYFLVFFLFPMKAKYFVLLMAAIELVMGVQASPADNVAHFAHLGGMIVGGIYVWLKYVNPPGGRGKNFKKDLEREKLKRQFRLIVNQGGEDDEEPRGPYWN